MRVKISEMIVKQDISVVEIKSATVLRCGHSKFYQLLIEILRFFGNNKQVKLTHWWCNMVMFVFIIVLVFSS